MPEMSLAQAHDLAIQFQREGRLQESESICHQILQHHPNHPEVLNTLAILAQQQGNLPEAIDLYQRAIALRPELPELHFNLGNVHKDLGDFQLAIDAYRKALSIRPDFRPALNNLANALKETGQLAEAKDLYRQTLAIHPDPRIASSLAYLMYFDPQASPADIAAEHKRWNDTYAQPLLPANVVHPNNRDPNRRLKIGYVSPDFRNHPVARFLLPLLANHHHDQFEIFCYSDVRRPDSMTTRLQSLVDQWRDTTRHSDEILAQLIRQDQIDILIDLTMHMEGNRLLAFARKSAPVQATYLAYAGTTGMPAIDYRFSDRFLDPPGNDESIYAERTLRLDSYWCYQPQPEAPDVAPLPALANGYITLGCLNNFSKINPPVLQAWRSIITQLPNSRLILAAHHGAHRTQVLQYFAEAGIAPEHVEFSGVLPIADYLAQYNRIDIALDPFPYPGGTTSLDAIYMGVPVITLPAQTAVSRAGVTILRHLDLPELIATNTDHYIEIATQMATDLPRLAALRQQLRPRLMNSPLTDAPSLTASIETAFRDIWRKWCEQSTP